MEAETKEKAERLRQSAAELLHDLSDLARVALDEAEKFIRDKPVASAAGAFLAGWMMSSMLRR